MFDGVMYVPGAGGSFLSRGQLEEMGWITKLEENVMSNGESRIQMFRNGRLHYVSAYSGFTLQLNFIGGDNPVYDEHVRLGHKIAISSFTSRSTVSPEQLSTQG